MEVWSVVLWIVVIAAAVAAVILLRKERGGGKHYDERQLVLRANGTKIGFYVTLIAEMLVLMLAEFGAIPPASVTLAVFVALMVGVVTFAVYCIAKDVFFSIGDKGRNYRILCAVIVLLDGAAAASRIVDGTILEDGAPTFGSCNALVLALSFLVILIALLVRNGREESDE